MFETSGSPRSAPAMTPRHQERRPDRARRLALAAAVALAALSAPAGSGLAQAPAPSLSNAEPVLAELGNTVVDRSAPVAERLKVIQMFTEWGTPQVRAPLVAVLDDPSPEIREAAARALGQAGNRD